MNSRFSRFPPLLGGLLFGLGAAALLQAVTWPGLHADELLREKVLVLGLGNFGLALLLAMVLGVGGRLRGRVPSPVTGAWMAFAFGAAPLAAFTLGSGLAAGFRSDSFLGKPISYGYLTGLLLLLATPLVARLRGRLDGIVAWGGGLLLLAWGALWFLVAPQDSRNLPPKPFPDPAGVAAAVDPPRGVPDLVLISIDTFRADAALEHPEDLPHFAELRRRGRWAPYALAPAPSTLPSHTTMLTGVEVLEHGARSNEFRVPDRLATLAELLHARGYRTAGVVSNGVLRGAAGFSRGFEVFDDLPVARGGSARLLRRTADAQTWLGWILPAETTETFVKDKVLGKLGGEGDAGTARGERTTEVALHYLDVLRKDERPFFLFVHFMDPHQPYHPDPSVAGRLTSGEGLPEEFRAEDAGGLSVVRRVEQALGKDDPEAREATGFLHDLYREEILFMDACVGRILDALDRDGRKTVLLVTGDHGEQFGEHNRMLHANTLYETLLRVPFVLVGPGIPAGTAFATPPHLEDVAPTLFSFADGHPLPSWRGRDLRKDDAGDRVQVAVRNREISLRRGHWKLLAWFRGAGSPDTEVTPRELYDLSADPGETRNLLETNPDKVQELSTQMRAVLKLAVAGEAARLDPEEAAMLEELGYAVGEDR